MAALPQLAWRNVDFYEEGDQYYRAILREIALATKSVLVEKYIFRFDETGQAVLKALAAAVRRGACAHLRVDGIGSRDHVPAMMSFCERNGIEFEVFHPLPFFARRRFTAQKVGKVESFFARFRWINRRTHRKLVIVDERVAFSGGRNIDDVESEARAGVDAWHDLSIRVTGDAVPALVHAFWLKKWRRQPSPHLLLNHDRRLRRSRNRWFHRQLRIARGRIWVVTPYFAPTPAMLYFLRQACRRGVDVRLVLPTKIDVPLSRWAARALYRHLLRWGVRIFEYQPRVLHRKLWVMDDVCVVGSGNLNHRSFMHDIELDVLLREPEALAHGKELFLKDQGDSAEVFPREFDRVSAFKLVVYWLASWLIYWL